LIGSPLEKKSLWLFYQEKLHPKIHTRRGERMEKSSELLGVLREKSYAFRTLEKNHSELELSLHNLNRRKILSAEEELNKKKFQKQKLAAKDTMNKILQHYELTGEVKTD